jgi:hypothetical protein
MQKDRRQTDARYGGRNGPSPSYNHTTISQIVLNIFSDRHDLYVFLGLHDLNSCKPILEKLTYTVFLL